MLGGSLWPCVAFAVTLMIIGFSTALGADLPALSRDPLAFSIGSPLGAVDYVPGRGLRIGETGLVLGGFAVTKAETTEATGGEFALDLLDFFLIFDLLPRFRAVAEFQMRDIFVASETQTGAQDFAFDVRRLFGDLTISDTVRLRAGTFLTPVGYWNLILAPPLTWTTEAPVIVEETFFQQTTTGVMLYGSTELGAGRLGYSVFSQLLKPLADDPDLDPPDDTAGLRLTYDTDAGVVMGATYQAAHTDGAWSYLGAAHLLWQYHGGELLGELYFQDGAALSSAQWGTYIQDVLEVWGPFYLVGRYEHYDQPSPAPTLNLFTVGAVCKPLSFMALKFEYRFVDRREEDDPEGFFSSFALLF